MITGFGKGSERSLYILARLAIIILWALMGFLESIGTCQKFHRSTCLVARAAPVGLPVVSQQKRKNPGQELVVELCADRPWRKTCLPPKILLFCRGLCCCFFSNSLLFETVDLKKHWHILKSYIYQDLPTSDPFGSPIRPNSQWSPGRSREDPGTFESHEKDIHREPSELCYGNILLRAFEIQGYMVP